MKSIKKFFLEPRVSFGFFFTFVFLLSFVVWFSTVKGNELKLLNLSDLNIIGEKIETTNFSIKVESVRRDDKGYGPIQPQPNSEFVVPTISVQNLTDEPIDFIPLLFFYVKDNEGNVYNVTYAPSKSEQHSGPILAHDKIREEVGFEIPKTAKGLKLYFEPGTADSIVVIDLENTK